MGGFPGRWLTALCFPFDDDEEVGLGGDVGASEDCVLVGVLEEMMLSSPGGWIILSFEPLVGIFLRKRGDASTLSISAARFVGVDVESCPTLILVGGVGLVRGVGLVDSRGTLPLNDEAAN